MVLTVGIDVGTRSTKIAVLEDGKKIIYKGWMQTGYDYSRVAKLIFEKALEELSLGIEELNYVVATGIGRYRVDFRDINVTEITSNARGAILLFPKTRSVLDIGAGNSRACKIDENGKVLKFASTEKCAAGGGGFLEKISFYTGYKIEDIGNIALKSVNPVEISTVCSVLAESEVINLVTQDVPMEDILMGAHLSIVGRVLVTLRRVGIEPEVTLTGGLALNPAIIKALKMKLGMNINAAPILYYAGAIGAARLGYIRLLKKGVIKS
jgi:predicted CoA-substrate-specific enzyme activase